jgi:hypothetical protein
VLLPVRSECENDIPSSEATTENLLEVIGLHYHCVQTVYRSDPGNNGLSFGRPVTELS